MNTLFQYRGAIILVHVLITAFFATRLPTAILDNDVTNFIPPEHPTRTDYAQTEEAFGGEMMMLLALEPPDQQALRSDNLERLVALTRELESIPHVDQVLSLATSKDVVAEGDSIVVRPLLGEGPLDEIFIEELRQRLKSWELYRNALVNTEETAYQIVLRFNAAIQEGGRSDTKRVVYDNVRQKVREVLNPEWKMYLSGTPVFTVLMSRSMQLDLIVLVPLVVLVLTVTLWLTLRRLWGVVLTLISVFEATVWSLGAMALLGVKLSLLATVIPVIMMAVGSAYAIHVLAHVFEEESRLHPDEGATSSISRAVPTIVKPVLLAALTTIAGFGSLAFTDILPVRDFGIFACFGVFAATLSALTLVPSLLSLLPVPTRKSSTPEMTDGGKPIQLLKSLTKHPSSVLMIWGAILVSSLFLASRLIVDNALVEFFSPQSEVALSDRYLRQNFAGTKTFSLVFQGPGPGSMTDPRVLALMDETTRYLESEFPFLGKALGFHHLIKRMNQVFFTNRRPVQTPATLASEDLPPLGFEADLPPLGFESTPTSAPVRQTEPSPENQLSDLDAQDWYEIPVEPARYGRTSQQELKGMIDNYLILLGDASQGLADDPLEPTQARINLQLRTSGNIETEMVKKAALDFARPRLPQGFTVRAVGVGLIEKAITDLIVGTQLANIFQSLAAVFLILLVSNRSLGVALLGLIPLGIALPINFGLMGLFGIKLNIATAMVSSIAIGVGIDYTIHLLEALRRSSELYPDWTASLHHAFQTSGRAILINALSVGLGFLVLLFSQFQPLIYLGALIAVTMGTTSLASLTVVPALIEKLGLQFLVRNKRFGGKK